MRFVQGEFNNFQLFNSGITFVFRPLPQRVGRYTQSWLFHITSAGWKNVEECKHNHCVVFMIAKADATGRSAFSESDCRPPELTSKRRKRKEVVRRRRFVGGGRLNWWWRVDNNYCSRTKRRFTAGRDTRIS